MSYPIPFSASVSPSRLLLKIRDVAQPPERLNEVTRPIQQQRNQERPEVVKIGKFFPNLQREQVVKLADNLNGINFGERRFVVLGHEDDGRYVGGLDLAKLKELSEFFDEKKAQFKEGGFGIIPLAVCLINNPQLNSETLSDLCKLFPTKDPQSLSDLTNEPGFSAKAVKEAIGQGVRFLDEKIDAGDVASALKLLKGCSIKSLAELSAKYPKQTINEIAALERLKVLFTEGSPEKILKVLTALRHMENSSVDEFVRLVDNGTLSTWSAVYALREYREYTKLMTALRELCPNSAPDLYMDAYTELGLDRAEFIRHVKVGTISQVEGEWNPIVAVNQYFDHKHEEQCLRLELDLPDYD